MGDRIFRDFATMAYINLVLVTRSEKKISGKCIQLNKCKIRWMITT